MNKKVLILLATILPMLTSSAYYVYGETYINKANASIKNIAEANTLNNSNLLSGSIIEKTLLFTPVNTKNARSINVWATAYTSDPNETDNTPYITASGVVVHNGVIATNFLPMGTKIVIPELFGKKIFTVEDRMNARYDNMNIIDIWFSTKTNAQKFGKKFITIKILK